MHTEMLIGSAFAQGTGAEETVLNPRTGKAIATVPEASIEQVNQAVAAAERAFAKWSRTTPGERAGYLLRLADRIAAEEQDFARLEALNCGKPLYTVTRDETPAVIDVLRFFAGAARVVPASAAGEYLPGFTSMVRRDPIGVVAQIAPWNYPLMMAAWKIAPALAAGNTVVLKPSEHTPLTTLKLARIAAEVLPEGVLNVVVGRGATVGDALINHPKVAMVSLTGSVGTGQKVLAAAAQSIKRTHLELGGKAPVIVFDDADIDAVVQGVRVFGYANAGQDCTAACRLYAGAKVYDKLVADLSAAVATIAYDLPDDDKNEIGPLISARQRERVAGYVDRARDEHACRGRRPAASPLPAAASTTSRRSSPEPGRMTRSCATRCSVRWSRSRASTTPRRPSPGRTIPTTGWPPRCGPGTSAGRWRSPPACNTAAPGSTATSC